MKYCNFEFESDHLANIQNKDLCILLSVDVKGQNGKIEGLILYNKDDNMKIVEISDLPEYEQKRILDRALFEIDMADDEGSQTDDKLFEFARDIALLNNKIPPLTEDER